MELARLEIALHREKRRITEALHPELLLPEEVKALEEQKSTLAGELSRLEAEILRAKKILAMTKEELVEKFPSLAQPFYPQFAGLTASISCPPGVLPSMAYDLVLGPSGRSSYESAARNIR